MAQITLNSSGVASSGSLLLQTNGTTTQATVDTSGNLGLGVAPSAWVSTFKSIDVSTYASFYGRTSAVTAGIASNAYQNSSGNWTYKANNYAAKYDVDTGQHVWWNAASGTAGNAITFTQAMTLDANGRLGIGTTSPGDKLTIAAGTSTGAAMTFWANGVTSSSELYVGQGASNEAYFFNRANSYLVFGTNNNERARIDSSGNLLIGTTSGAGSGNIYLGTAGASLTYTAASSYLGLITTTATPIVFQTNSSERARIDSSGNLLVACTAAPSSTVAGVRFNNPVTASPRISVGATTAANTMLFFTNGNGDVGNIATSGSSTTYNTSSDYRLKENIQPMTGALSVVTQLKPVTYTWKADGSAGQGFIAHELAEVVPQCVTGEKDAVDAEGNPVYQGIDTSFLVATLTAALQEMKAIVDAQAARITALEQA